MSKTQLNGAVARATGETLQTIQRRGFSVLPFRPRRSRRKARHRSGCTKAASQGDLKETAGAK